MAAMRKAVSGNLIASEKVGAIRVKSAVEAVMIGAVIAREVASVLRPRAVILVIQNPNSQAGTMK
jgi:hypothetical protein